MSLKEHEIRPQELMAGLAVEVEADRQWLHSHAAEFVECACPACDGSGHFAFAKKGFSYELCSTCRTVFMNPRPSQTIMHKFYEQSRTYAYWNRSIFPASESSRRARIFVPRADRLLDFCKKYEVNAGTLLEIGAGFGTFCKELQSRQVFQRIIALEMTPDLAETCRSRGLEVLEQPVEKLELADQSVDVIVAFETLEHLFSPIEFLSRCKRLLKPNGLIVLTCPSIDGFDVVTLGEHSDTIDHEHVNYFNPNSIKHFATRCGLRALEVITPGQLDADIVRNKIMQGTLSVESQPWLKQILIDKWDIVGQAFQDFLVANRLSTHMWMIATVA